MPDRREEALPIRVLLVDDHFAMRLGLKATLQGTKGIEVVGEAKSGEEALDLVERLGPDVVLMDVSMSGLGGVEATRRICLMDRGIRVIGMSMFEEREAGEALRGAGAVGYVNKTEVRARLVEMIRTHGPARSAVLGPRAEAQ